MRSLMLLLLCAGGCAAAAQTTVSVREVEMAYDDGHPAERPILPSGSYELLIKEEPHVPAFRPVQLRFMLAQPGRLVFHLYDTGPDGRPGQLLHTIDHAYPPAMSGSNTDGKWVIENLPELPTLHGPLWVGVGLSDPSSEARVWFSLNDSGHVYQRDAEPQTAVISAPVHQTPMVRLIIAPQ